MRRDLNSGLHIVLNVNPGEEAEVKIRGARCKDGFYYVKKTYYNLAAFEKWIPSRYNMADLLKRIDKPPYNRKREVISSPPVIGRYAR